MTDQNPLDVWLPGFATAMSALPGARADTVVQTDAQLALRLAELARESSRFAWDCWRLYASGAPQPESAAGAPLQAAILEQYWRLIAPPPAPAMAAPTAPAGLAAALARCQRAAQALAAQAVAIATDAARRLGEELARPSPPAPPITTLRELHALWIECGEAAWAAAVRQDAWVNAQAEWLAALVEWQFEQRRLSPSAAAGTT